MWQSPRLTAIEAPKSSSNNTNQMCADFKNDGIFTAFNQPSGYFSYSNIKVHNYIL